MLKKRFCRKKITSDKLNDLLKANNVIVIQAKNFRMFEALCRKLGKGESEAIVLAIEQSAHLVILDDHVARAEATRIGLNIKGTLGIIRRLLDLNVIQYDLDELYRDLMEMKFRVKRGIFNEVFKRSVL